MTLPANIRVNIGAPFPETVKGSGVVGIQKVNGIWTILLNFGALLPAASAIADPANTVVLVWNTVTGVYSLVPASAVAGSKQIKTIGVPGVYNALPNDEIIFANAPPLTVNVDWSARTKPLRVVDGSGTAAANNITITPSVGQKQLGQVNYSYIIDSNGGSIILTPLPDGTGAY